jgi:hypothetical protein
MRGRLAFPPRETATASPSATERQDNSSHLDRAGLEVNSEKFNLTFQSKLPVPRLLFYRQNTRGDSSL